MKVVLPVQAPIPVISRGRKGEEKNSKEEGKKKASQQLTATKYGYKMYNTSSREREEEKHPSPLYSVQASEVGFYRRGNLEPLVRFAAH